MTLSLNSLVFLVDIMNSKIGIIGVVIAIIIGAVFVFISTNNTDENFGENSSKNGGINTDIGDVETQQTEGKQFTVELSDSISTIGE